MIVIGTLHIETSNGKNCTTCNKSSVCKYKELYDRMKEDGICGYEFPDDEDFNNVLRALIIADREERKKR